MFDRYTYLVYTLLFCLPPVLILWSRREYAQRMRRDLAPILGSTLALTLYGSAIWPLAMRWRCWSYSDAKVLGVLVFGWVHLEDTLWWLLVSFLCTSFVSLSTRYEAAGLDVVLCEFQPSPTTQRIATPVARSTKAAASSAGRPETHSSKPNASHSAVSG